MSGAAIENRVFFMTPLTLKAELEVAKRYWITINIAGHHLRPNSPLYWHTDGKGMSDPLKTH